MGGVPKLEHIESVSAVPVLVLGGELDGIFPMSHFAAAMAKLSAAKIRFGIVEGGLSHHSFASGRRPRGDIEAESEEGRGHGAISNAILGFLKEGHEDAMRRSEVFAQNLAGPIIAALQLEGSDALGTDICNSDFPTNPSCKPYPKFPDFSLPPGPAPAPSPLPSNNCVCGSKWVTDYAFPEVSGSEDVGFHVIAADAFHSVSDTHPFHLPHIWNTCPKPQGCSLNVTTLTENLKGSGSLFPNGTNAPLSALELRTKMKSRTSLYTAVGLTPPSDVDKNYTICRRANEMAWEWALQHAEETVRQRFEQRGEKFVMVDDKEAPIGLGGPTWIKKELVYTRVNGTVQVQSWSFIVGNFPIKTKYIPSGMHYCKLLSPARAMEWIYTYSHMT
jgi:hypothetical protein